MKSNRIHRPLCPSDRALDRMAAQLVEIPRRVERRLRSRLVAFLHDEGLEEGQIATALDVEKERDTRVSLHGFAAAALLLVTATVGLLLLDGDSTSAVPTDSTRPGHVAAEPVKDEAVLVRLDEEAMESAQI